MFQQQKKCYKNKCFKKKKKKKVCINLLSYDNYNEMLN